MEPLSDKPLEALQQILQAMRSQSDPKDLVDLSLRFVGHVFVAPLIWLGIYDYNTHQMMGQGGVTLLEDDAFLHSVMPLPPGGILEQVVIEQRAASIPDISQEPRMGSWQQQAQPMGGIQGCIIYPIRYERRCLGVLMLGSQVWGVTITDEERALIGILLEHLAASLQQLESKWQAAAEKTLEDPLLALMQIMRDATSLEQRMQVGIESLREFLGVGRIQVYTFEAQTGHFLLWGSEVQSLGKPATPRGGSPKPGAAKPAPVTVLKVRELGDMYAILRDGQVVATTEAMGTARSEVPPKLMQQLRAQALLAAPMLVHGELLGFVAAMSDAARLWEDADRQMIGSVATMLGFGIPIGQQEKAMAGIQAQRGLVQELADNLHGTDLRQRVGQALQAFCEQLKAHAVAILVAQGEGYSLYAEHWRSVKGAFPQGFRALSPQDWTDFSRHEALVAENYQQDLRLLSWQAELNPLEVRSLMVAHTETGTAPPVEGLVLVIHQQLRSWTRVERQGIRALAQQLGVILKMARLDRAVQQQTRLLQGSTDALVLMQSLYNVPDVLAATLRAATEALDTPLAVMVTWDPDATEGSVTFHSRQSQVNLVGSTQVDMRRDPLIVQCIQSAEGWVSMAEGEILAPTRSWLSASGPALGQVLAVPVGYLASGLHPLGILLVVAHESRDWSPEQIRTLATLAQTCCWTMRRIQWVQGLQSKVTELQELNWYKHRRLGDLQTSLMDQLRRLGQVPETPGSEEARWQKVVEIARTLREGGLLAQPVLRGELWKAYVESGTLSMAALIRRTLRRLELLVQKRKLWPRVHGETNFSVTGDPGRIEIILYEVMLVAVARSPMEARLDVWVDPQGDYANLIVQDQGNIPEALLAALQEDPVQKRDPLATHPLSISPGLELSLCQRMMAQMGGQLDFYPSQEGYAVSRLVLPMSVTGFST